MPLILVCSPKGGVGKTTLAANVGAALAELGCPVRLVDLDPQNALRLHFGVGLAHCEGWISHTDLATATCNGTDWNEWLVPVSRAIGLVPYGSTTAPGRAHFEHQATLYPEALQQRVRGLASGPQHWILVDTPPGLTEPLRALLPVADLRLVVLAADATSLALLPRIENGELGEVAGTDRIAPFEAGRRALFVLNQVDIRRRLNRDVTRFMQHRLRGRGLCLVRQDEAFVEACASQQTILDRAPESAGTRDILCVAAHIQATLAPSNSHAVSAQN